MDDERLELGADKGKVMQGKSDALDNEKWGSGKLAVY